MPDHNDHDDAEIIRSAYAERVREAFKVFSENLAVGQGEQVCRDNFKRQLQLVRKTRDLALQACAEGIQVELRAAPREGAAAEKTSEALSPEDQALVDQALAGTTGHAAPVPVPRYRGR